jgi:dihydrofolate reductase
MANVIWSIGVSLDGYIADAAGEFDWAAPDPELHRFHNEQTLELGAHLLGRRLYETMLPWETMDASAGDELGDFARIWQALPKIVFSSTLSAVEGNAQLATGSIEAEVARLGDAEVAVGGAGLAAELTRRGLIDEYRLFVSPVVVGGGTPYFPALAHRIGLELLETRTFGSRVVYLRYRREAAR